MEYIICCLCSLMCFVCGVWAAHGVPQTKHRQREQDGTQADDALSRDIAALLAYTGPKTEEDMDADS